MYINTYTVYIRVVTISYAKELSCLGILLRTFRFKNISLLSVKFNTVSELIYYGYLLISSSAYFFSIGHTDIGVIFPLAFGKFLTALQFYPVSSDGLFIPQSNTL